MTKTKKEMLCSDLFFCTDYYYCYLFWSPGLFTTEDTNVTMDYVSNEGEWSQVTTSAGHS